MARPSGTVVPLTDAQRKLVEDNHHLIYGYLRKWKFDIEEWYGYAAIGLCRAAKVYDESKGYAFSTIAYYNMRSVISKQTDRQKRRSKFAVGSLDAELPEKGTFHDTTPDPTDYAETAVANIVWREFFAILNPNEMEILQLQMDGLPQKEIGRRLGISQVQASRKLIKIKAKLKELLNDSQAS